MQLDVELELGLRAAPAEVGSATVFEREGEVLARERCRQGGPEVRRARVEARGEVPHVSHFVLSDRRWVFPGERTALPEASSKGAAALVAAASATDA